MKIRVPLVLLSLLLCCVAAPAGAKDKGDNKGAAVARCVEICNSAGLTGVQDITPFVCVPHRISLSDTTQSDTMLTSTAVWVGRPLYRLVKDHESRIDLDGPQDLTVVTMMPFAKTVQEFARTYTMSVRIDDGDPQIVTQGTRRGNPIYTTRVPGLTFGIPRALMVNVPGGKHSVYLKPVDGPFEFLYAIFYVTAPPRETPGQ